MSDLHLLVSGSRDWTDREAIRRSLVELKPALVIHGDHWQGADQITKELCFELGFDQKPFPARWKRQGGSAGPRRNQQMVNYLVYEIPGDVQKRVLAFHSLKKSPGTDDLIKRARMLALPIKVVWAPRTVR